MMTRMKIANRWMMRKTWDLKRASQRSKTTWARMRAEVMRVKRQLSRVKKAS